MQTTPQTNGQAPSPGSVCPSLPSAPLHPSLPSAQSLLVRTLTLTLRQEAMGVGLSMLARVEKRSGQKGQGQPRIRNSPPDISSATQGLHQSDLRLYLDVLDYTQCLGQACADQALPH